MTEVLKMNAPLLGDAKDPNDARDNPKFRRYLETEMKGTPKKSTGRGASDQVHQPDQSVEGTIEHSINGNSIPTFEPETITSDFNSIIDRLPPREFVLDKTILRGAVTAILAPGGVGKTTFASAMALSIASGRSLMGLEVIDRCNVLIINNEDPPDEVQRKFGGVMISHEVSAEELDGRVFYFSSIGYPVMIAERMDRDNVAQSQVFEGLRAFIIENSIVAVFIDPFISTHDVPENDNTSIDKVITLYKRLARETGAAICVVHHTRKAGGDSEAHAGDAESGRGGIITKGCCTDCLDTRPHERVNSYELGF